MMNFGLMEDVANRVSFWTAVTHLDHLGHEARLEQAKILAEWFGRRPGPRVLMGDFNDVPGSAVHRVLTAPETGLRDTWQALLRGEDEASMTHHNFFGVPQQCRMDWVLASPEFRVIDAVVVRANREGRYPSDHFPYAVELDWEKNARSTNSYEEKAKYTRRDHKLVSPALEAISKSSRRSPSSFRRKPESRAKLLLKRNKYR